MPNLRFLSDLLSHSGIAKAHLIQKKFANFETKVQLNHKIGYCFQFL